MDSIQKQQTKEKSKEAIQGQQRHQSTCKGSTPRKAAIQRNKPRKQQKKASKSSKSKAANQGQQTLESESKAAI
jgi:hypothetical protein